MNFKEPRFVYKQKVSVIGGFYTGQVGEVTDMFLPYGTSTRIYSIRNTDGDLCHKIKEYELEEWNPKVLEISVDQEITGPTWWHRIWEAVKCFGQSQ